MKSLDLFLPKVHQFAPGVADPTAYEWLREAAIEFCARTRSWRSFDEYTVVGREAEEVRAPDGAVIHEIELVRFNGVDLKPAAPSDLDLETPGWRTGTAVGRPRFYTQMEPNTLALAPLGAGSVTAWLVLKPAPDALEVPDFLADQHRQVIADGALSRILLLPNQPYSNPALANAMMGSFQRALAQQATKGVSGQQRAHPRSKPNTF